MFKKITIVFVILFLCLSLLVWQQHQTIIDLEATTKAQAQTIAQQQKANQALQDNLELERQAVEQQQQTVNQLRANAEAERANVKALLSTDKCGQATLPGGVINSIKRVHNSNYN